MSLRTLLITLSSCVLIAATAAADDLNIIAGSLDNNDRRIVYVTFDSPQPNASDVLPARFWTVVQQRTSPAAVGELAIERVAIATCGARIGGRGTPKPLFTSCPPGEVEEAALQLAVPVSPTVTELLITYAGSAGLATYAVTDKTALGVGAPTTEKPLSAAKADDADIYFSGSYTVVASGDRTYDIDTFAGYMWTLMPSSTTNFGRVGFYGQAKTKDSATADPDSFLGFLAYQRVLGAGGFVGPIQSPYVNIRAAGWEFDKKGQQRNFLVSPVLTVPVRLTSGFLGPIAPGVTTPHVTLQLGTEIVRVQKSQLAPVGEWHARWLVGATFAAGFAPQVPWLDSVKATASYQVRFLGAPEVFTDPRHAPIDPATGQKGDPVPELGDRPRHSVDATITYALSKWLGLSAEYSYGSRPPVFVLTDHTFTFGLTLSLQQTSYGRYSILRP